MALEPSGAGNEGEVERRRQETAATTRRSSSFPTDKCLCGKQRVPARPWRRPGRRGAAIACCLGTVAGASSAFEDVLGDRGSGLEDREKLILVRKLF